MSNKCPYCTQSPRGPGPNCVHCGRNITGPDVDWFDALEAYYYHVDLSHFADAARFPSFFNIPPVNDRPSTKRFEKRFRTLFNATTGHEAVLELTYWKMFSLRHVRNRHVRLRDNGMAPAADVVAAANTFLGFPTRGTCDNLLDALGMARRKDGYAGGRGIALAMTIPAFMQPHEFPMADRKIAEWVNAKVALGALPPVMYFRHIPLLARHWDAYWRWVLWTRDKAVQLGRLQPKVGWRPRDVEMAVFTAHDGGWGHTLRV